MPASMNLYEINTRVWLRAFDTPARRATLARVDPGFWDELARKGMDQVWLMGIWKTCESAVEKYAFEEGLVREYQGALKDWKREDVIGSPYAIDAYTVNPRLGTLEDLAGLRSDLNRRGMGLILDWVPNHFSAETSLLGSHPEIFLEAGPEELRADPHTFFRPRQDEDRIFARGRDPFFPAWQDTVQVNPFSQGARRYMTAVLEDLTKVCDGLRCDMAMLPLSDVFLRTWGPVLSRQGYQKPAEEFWKVAIDRVRAARKDFLLIAEAYWDLEGDLQHLGFDYTYDKRLRDRLLSGDAGAVRDHLLAGNDYQRKSVRFIENHDEQRAVAAFGRERSTAAALVTGTVQGLHLYHHGQFEGKKVRLPVQLGREPVEPEDPGLGAFYDRLLGIVKHEVFRQGEWVLLETRPAWEGDPSGPGILGWLWKGAGEKRMVLVNLSDRTSTCRVRMDLEEYPEEFRIEDLLNDRIYLRSSREATDPGLYIELEGYQGHIFRY